VTWNGTGPINQYVDPLTYAERLELSFHEVQALTALGMPGVWTWNFGDDFAHLYLDAIATNHNSDGRGYETFGNGTAETLIPEQQGDPVRVAQLVARLLAQGIEVQRAAADLTLREGTFPAGTYVVRLDQPYRNYAVDLLAAQDYPRDAGEPYDDVSWELPAHYHLAAIPTADPRVRAANL